MPGSVHEVDEAIEQEGLEVHSAMSEEYVQEVSSLPSAVMDGSIEWFYTV